MSCSPCVLARLARCSARIEGLAAEDRQAAIDRATALVRDRVRPAYERVLALMNELHPRTTADAGLWRLPQGDKAYAQALANYTTTLDADAIHALGLREVARSEGWALYAERLALDHGWCAGDPHASPGLRIDAPVCARTRFTG